MSRSRRDWSYNGIRKNLPAASYQLSGPAVRDLQEIYDWIAEDDPVAADRVMLDLREAIERLVDVPGLGHVRDDLGDPTLRAWTVHRWRHLLQQPAGSRVVA